MKKKILSFILAVCLIIPCAFIFSACGEKPADPIMHTVTFVYDNGMENSTIEVEEGKLATKPTDPSKTGYNFAGWYVDDEKWSFALIPVTQDIELTAKWNIKTFTVTFKYDNGLEDRETICNYGDKVKEPQQPQRNTDVFLGWYNGETKWDFENDTISDNLELTAKWSPNRLAVTFDKDNGEGNMVNVVAYGSKLNRPANPSKTGYTFGGWYFGDYEWNFGYNTVTEKLTLKARWIAINYSITYELDGGTNNESNLLTYTVETNFNFAEPTKDGYKFMGWFIDGEFTTEITSTNDYHQNLTIYAKWLKLYTITYDLTGGINHPDNPSTFTEDEEVVLKAPTTDDPYYTFAGWVIDYATDEEISIIPVGTTKNMALRATWDLVYTITNVGSDIKTITGLTELGKTLTKITIPRDVKVIDDYAFKSSYNLEEVVFYENSAVLIETGAFKDCSRLNSVVLPNNTFGIKGDAFYNCIKLTSISIPSSVKEIGDYAFANCSALKSVIFAENIELTGISRSAFAGCSALEAITIPQSVIDIETYAFNGCSKLASVIFETGRSLTQIKDNAFNGCSSLTTITIPKSVKIIEKMAFKGCGFETITFENKSTLFYIGKNAFSDCKNLKSITIPKSVTEIDDNAFDGCYELETVNFETDSALTYIGSKVFNGCTSLTTIIIPSSVEMIGNYLFDEFNHNIESIVFEDTSTWYKTSSQDDWGNKTNGTEVDVSNSTNNTEYFKNSYYLYKINS